VALKQHSAAGPAAVLQQHPVALALHSLWMTLMVAQSAQRRSCQSSTVSSSLGVCWGDVCVEASPRQLACHTRTLISLHPLTLNPQLNPHAVPCPLLSAPEEVIEEAPKTLQQRVDGARTFLTSTATGKGISIAAGLFLGATLLIAMYRTWQKYSSPRAQRMRVVSMCLRGGGERAGRGRGKGVSRGGSTWTVRGSHEHAQWAQAWADQVR
jgi:hypothetical protein